MKRIVLPLVVLFLFGEFCLAQMPPVRTVTVFKNGKSLIQKSGKVSPKEGKWSVTDLPDALFGTFWVTSPTNDLVSVYSQQDSVEIKELMNGKLDFLQKNIGKPIELMLATGSYSDRSYRTVSGVIEKLEKVVITHDQQHYSRSWDYIILLRTPEGGWLTVSITEVVQIKFLEKPSTDFDSRTIAKKARETLSVNFKSNKLEQEIGMLYLTNNLGWLPVYSLILAEKGKSRLTLRAEIANDAEDLGDAELRLAVGVPNFAFANRSDWLVNFFANWMPQSRDNQMLLRGGQMLSNYSASQYSYDRGTSSADPGENFEGAQAEDFYFYTIRPGNFPKNSRYQYPIFEAEVEPTHFYECRLADAGPNSFSTYREQQRNPNEPKNPVFHFVEFSNPTQYPFTTGVVNILSQSNNVTYPLSQDQLNYTSPSAKCKVKIAQSPEIKVTHGEGDVERKEDAFRFFGRSYDEIKVEGQVYAVNYKKESVTLKIKRTVEGTPLASEQKWETGQEQATLRVNPSYEVEWVIELKPGEEKKWKYSYLVYMDL
jgi:hypothetical protein